MIPIFLHFCGIYKEKISVAFLGFLSYNLEHPQTDFLLNNENLSMESLKTL